MQSLAGYSIVCYILQIKDRHNGNILIDRQGCICHIDFGFFLSISPGGNLGFERAPFKLTKEFVELLGGPRSNLFRQFRALCVQGFIAARKQAHKITGLLEMLRNGYGQQLPCFSGGDRAIQSLVMRFHPRQNMSRADCGEYINRLINESLEHWTTKWYDRFQYYCQGIFM